MTRVAANAASDGLRLGLGTLLALTLGISGWLAWLLLLSWSRRVAQVETALAGHATATPPHLDATGEPDLDRIVGGRDGRLGARGQRRQPDRGGAQARHPPAVAAREIGGAETAVIRATLA